MPEVCSHATGCAVGLEQIFMTQSCYVHLLNKTGFILFHVFRVLIGAGQVLVNGSSDKALFSSDAAAPATGR